MIRISSCAFHSPIDSSQPRPSKDTIPSENLPLHPIVKQLLQALALVTAVASTPLVAQTRWSHSFKVADGPIPFFEGGVLSPLRAFNLETDGPGYALNGFASRPNPNAPDEPNEIQFLSRFDHSGQNLWNLALEPGGAAHDLDLVPLASAPDLLFATYHEAPKATTKAFRLGLFSGSENSTIFAKRFETSITEPHAVEFFDDARIGATIDRGPTLDSVVFDQFGDTVFHKRYSSPGFSASTRSNTQSFVRDFLPSRDAYLTSVSNKSDFPSQITLISFFTDLAGEVTSSSSLQFSPEIIGAFPLPSSLADGGILYRFIGNFNGITVGGTPLPVTHLIKINADRSLAWAHTLYSSLLQGVFSTPDALYLTGSQRTPNGNAPGQTDALVIQLDPATGALLNQAAFANIADLDFVQGLIADGNHTFITINSRASGFDPETPSRSATSTLVKMDLDLKNPVAKRSLGDDQISSLSVDRPLQNNTRFIFSPSQNADREIRAFTLDANLEPVSDCHLFTSFIPTLSTVPVSLSRLIVTIAPASVAATDLTTAIADTTIPLTSYPLTTTEVCSLTRGLEIQLAESGDELILTFPTEVGTTYRLLFSPDLTNSFTEVDALTGSGNPTTFTRPLGNGRGFYRLSPPPTGE